MHCVMVVRINSANPLACLQELLVSLPRHSRCQKWDLLFLILKDLLAAAIASVIRSLASSRVSNIISSCRVG